MVAKTFGIVALRKDFLAATLPEFIAYAKSNPGKINLGHAGIGSSNYLICIAVEGDTVKKRFADLSTVAPDAGEHTPEVLQQLVTRDVAKYHALLAGPQ
jgi:tripartite tricarboxylate transporter family receptor